MPEKDKIPEEERPRILALNEAGQSFAAIGRQYGVSGPAISYIVKRAKQANVKPATLGDEEVREKAPAAPEPAKPKAKAKGRGAKAKEKATAPADVPNKAPEPVARDSAPEPTAAAPQVEEAPVQPVPAVEPPAPAETATQAKGPERREKLSLTKRAPESAPAAPAPEAQAKPAPQTAAPAARRSGGTPADQLLIDAAEAAKAYDAWKESGDRAAYQRLDGNLEKLRRAMARVELDMTLLMPGV